MSQNLRNKVALVTGGSSGIGLAAARELVERGARVYITGRNEDALSAAVESLGDRAVAIRADSSNLEDIDRTLDRIRDAGDTIDVLFYNAGVAKFAPFEQTDESLFDQVVSINLKGAYFTVQKALPLLADGASVILNGSAGVNVGLPGASAYLASKGALQTLAKTIAAELIGRGIRVNVVHPGATATPIFGKTGLPEAVVAQLGEQLASDIPLKRLAEPAEIARAVAFLASDESSYIVGTNLVVDGGMTQI